MDEEFFEHFHQARREFENAEIEKLVRPGLNRLKMVGLNLEDLSHHQTVLDLGAGEGYIARAVNARKMNTRVISMDVEPPPLEITNLGLPFYQFDLTKPKEWPSDVMLGEPTLAISKQGPLFISSHEPAARAFLEQALSKIKESGEFRVYPVRFNFIIQQLFGDDPKYWELKRKLLKDLLSDPVNNQFNLEANKQSQKWLSENRFKFQTRKIENFDGPSSNSEYLVLTK